MLLSASSSQLLVVDVQERLLPVMDSGEACLGNILRLAKAARHLRLPVTVSEQYPHGLGPSVAPIRAACDGWAEIASKMSFSCGGDEQIAARLARFGRQLVLCGIEAHVCVLQSALDLAARHFDVFVVADAVASREAASKEIALRRLECAGIVLVTVEMVIFEWLGRAGTPKFKALQQLIK